MSSFLPFNTNELNIFTKSPLTPLCQRGETVPPLEKGGEGGFSE